MWVNQQMFHFYIKVKSVFKQWVGTCRHWQKPSEYNNKVIAGPGQHNLLTSKRNCLSHCIINMTIMLWDKHNYTYQQLINSWINGMGVIKVTDFITFL